FVPALLRRLPSLQEPRQRAESITAEVPRRRSAHFRHALVPHGPWGKGNPSFKRTPDPLDTAEAGRAPDGLGCTCPARLVQTCNGRSPGELTGKGRSQPAKLESTEEELTRIVQ